ncbi:integrase core domain-containing protein [Gracilibacillus suaedae]|uniref:integrase core domain-containing protein n=1 Tax=Gracilibacillus suaedae TaxID=2820273 RepID=UPI001E490D1F|nr:integrase core domain-containing protein [Gracilibacillus suaedae]
MFRTLKYRPDFPHKGFASLEEARKWAQAFVHWYNQVHQHSGLNFVTPEQCHTGEHIAILEKHREVYDEGMKKHPERWARSVRNWSSYEQVALNLSERRRKRNHWGNHNIPFFPSDGSQKHGLSFDFHH